MKKKEVKLKIQKLVSELKENDKYYLDKLILLTQLLTEPDTGHIINKDIAEWCTEVGFKVCHHCEDKTSWTTCCAI